jgi:methyl-galactoside transport system substrate-binding protein
MNCKLIRYPAILAALLLALCPLSACGAQPKLQTVRVGVALYQQDDTFISTVVQHLEQLVQEEEISRNIKINLNLADGRSSQSLQNEQVDRFLDQGCDVICVNVVDRTAAAVIVDKAQSAGVPVIFFNREPVEEDLARWEHAYYVGSKAERAGRLQGRIVASAWQADAALDHNGDGIVQYVMLEGEPGHQDALLRTEYSVKTLTQADIPVEKLANDTADWQRGQASILMQQWLEAFGSRIEVVFANNDDMALGAIDACLSAGLAVDELPFIVGVDATPPALDAVAEGTLQGTVQNDAAGQAAGILSLICAFIDGVPPSDAVDLEDGTYVWLTYTTVTADNLEDFR